MPLRADRAWRRNWMTETPGISWGYWKARNMPALARSSAGHSVTSSPLNVIGARGHLVLGGSQSTCRPGCSCRTRWGP